MVGSPHVRLVEELSVPECWRHVAGARQARVALTHRALPVVLPVEYGLLDRCLVVRTSTGSWFGRSLTGVVVAVEVDGWDHTAGSGWSVLIVGEGVEITEGAERARAMLLDLDPWTTDPAEDRFVRISTRTVSGRRTRRVGPDAPRP